MNNAVYEECMERWSSSVGNQPFWKELSDKHGYSSPESLRSQFKRERKRRGEVKPSAPIINIPKPRIGVMDIETLYAVMASWSMFGVDFSPEMILEEGVLLSWVGMVYGEDTVYSDILTPKEARKRDPRRIVESAYEFMRSCDILVGHNSRNFDFKLMNTFFLDYRLPRIVYNQIDTLEILKANFKLPFNRLAYVNKRFGIREKMPNDGLPLWKACATGDAEALNTMLEYNTEDVLATTELFTLLYPYAKGVPNFSSYALKGSAMCSCGSTNIVREGTWTLNLGIYEKYRCKACGSVVRGRQNLMPKEDREDILVKL